jgi:Zn-dependent protease
MSWQDRDYAREDENPYRRLGGPGGDLSGVRPTLENPISWSLPLGRIAGISVRVHVILLAFIIFTLMDAALPTGGGGLSFGLTALWLAFLFGIVLLHEFGHCAACRSVGGEANEILMWPLGGLAYCRPPNHWKAHFITAAGGPLVNVLIFAILAPILGAATGTWWGIAIPNPFDFDVGPVAHSMLLMTLSIVNWLNAVLVLFNLLPIFPFDGGLIMQALAWPGMGYSRSMRLAVVTGYVGGACLAVLAIATRSWLLLFLALFGAWTCYVTSRQLAFTDAFMGSRRGRGAPRAPASAPAARPTGRRGGIATRPGAWTPFSTRSRGRGCRACRPRRGGC